MIIQAQQKIELIGTCTLTQAGSFRMDSAPFDVKIILSVDTVTSKITGQEFWKNKNNQYEKKETIEWIGEVLNIQALRLQQK